MPIDHATLLEKMGHQEAADLLRQMKTAEVDEKPNVVEEADPPRSPLEGLEEGTEDYNRVVGASILDKIRQDTGRTRRTMQGGVSSDGIKHLHDRTTDEAA